MANIIEEFLEAREFNYSMISTKETKDTTALGTVTVKHEVYTIDGFETLDGLNLTITVNTAYIAGIPFAQDFIIRSNRGVTIHGSAGDVFHSLKMFL